MKRKMISWAVVSVLALALAWSACNGRDDDEDEGAQGTPAPGACDNNDAPTLAEAVLYADGEAVAAGGEVSELASIEVYLSYDDVQCNAGGGEIVATFDGQTSESFPAAGNAPCTAVADDRALGFSFLPGAQGALALSVKLVDRCGAESDAVELTYEVVAWAPDDDAADDDSDDDTVEPTLLTGEITYSGESELIGRPVYLLLWRDWLPQPADWEATYLTAVPETGFPFTYEWDLDEAEVAAGDYYLMAFADAVAADGFFNAAVDPVHAPYLPTTIVAAQTNVANLTLVQPGE
mgnify:CR=1 FL=1